MPKDQIISYAKEILNIDEIGFCLPKIPKEDLDNYYQYLQADNYGDMLWMETRKELRSNPLAFFLKSKTAIIVGINYFDEKTPKDYEISIYANQKQDYHKWVYKKCKSLAKYLKEEFNADSRYFVDSAPILEKVLAKQTSIGWQGKHTCLVSRNFGNWLFLGVILTDLTIEADIPSKDFCGTCTKCIEACPTGALSPYKLDVKKCISYLTIEHKGDIPKEIHKQLGKRIFGCDECLKACHFNKWQKDSHHEKVKENEKFPKSLQDFLNLNEEDFFETFKGTPIKRTGLQNILRNVKIAKINQ